MRLHLDFKGGWPRGTRFPRTLPSAVSSTVDHAIGRIFSLKMALVNKQRFLSCCRICVFSHAAQKANPQILIRVLRSMGEKRESGSNYKHGHACKKGPHTRMQGPQCLHFGKNDEGRTYGRGGETIPFEPWNKRSY
jgi:hypothetical protein